MASTDVGHLNPQQQRVLRRVGPSASFSGQYVYELQCERLLSSGANCGHLYGANGCDIDGAGAGSGRLCPSCQNGAPSEQVTA